MLITILNRESLLQRDLHIYPQLDVKFYES